MQRLVIINYGSGNLHSAAKAFERAARESEADARIEVSANPAAVAAADRIVLPGVGAFADCKAGLDAVAGMREALETSVRDKRRPVPRHLRRRATDGRARPGIPHHAGVRLDQGRREGHRAEATRAQDPAHGLEHAARGQRAPAAGGHSRPGPKGLHAYFVHSFHLAAADRARAGGGDGLRWTGDRDGRGRQHRGHAVPPGEEPDAGTCGSSPTS